MSIFKLTVRSPTNVFPDTEGADLAGVVRAVQEARMTARELWADGIRKGEDRRDWVIEVSDDAGEVLRTIRFEETAKRG